MAANHSLFIIDFIEKNKKLPDGFNQWDELDTFGNSVAHWVAKYKIEYLPDDFEYWDLRNFGGVTVAHWAATNNVLSADFKYWRLEDYCGKSVAHYAARKSLLPDGFCLWDICDKEGNCISHVISEYCPDFLIRNNFTQWELKNGRNESVFEIAIKHSPDIFKDSFPCWDMVIDDDFNTCRAIWENNACVFC